MINKTYFFHQDEAHGWLEVSTHVIMALKIQDKISEYSYMNEGKVYLEEDCDMILFEKAFKKQFKQKPKVQELPMHNLKGIRGFARYQVKGVVQEMKFKVGDYVFHNGWHKKDKVDYCKWKIIEIGNPHYQITDKKGKHPIMITIEQITTTYHDGSKWTDEPWIKKAFSDELTKYDEKIAKKLWDEAIERGHR